MLNNEASEGIEWELDMLKKLRFEHRDDLPEKQLMPGDPDYDKYKCRTVWWQNVLRAVELLDGHIPPGRTDILAEIEDIKAYVASIDYTYGKPRTKEEIDGANERLDKLVGLLSKGQ